MLFLTAPLSVEPRLPLNSSLNFMLDFRIAKVSDRKYINLTRNSAFIRALSSRTGLQLTSYFLGNGDIKKCWTIGTEKAQLWIVALLPKKMFPLTAPSRSSQCLVVKIQDAMCVYDNLGITILRDLNPASPRHSQLCIVDAFSATEITFAPLRYQLLFHDKTVANPAIRFLLSAL